MQKIHSLVKNRKYTVHEQLSSLQACFKGGRYERRYNGFTWWFEVTPTPLSDTYLLKIVYNLKSATKPLKVLIAFTRPLITEFADNLNLKHPLLPTISPYPTM